MPGEEIRPAANPFIMNQSRLAARQGLLLCARCRFDGAAGLESLLRRGIDWAFFLDQGLRHGLLPLAYNRLRRLDGDRVPPEAMADLEASYYGCLARNVRLQASLAEAVTVLQREGIEPIVVKGGALAGTVYANPGLRPMGDLDLLVPTQAMEPAGAALSAIGYHLARRLSARMEAFQARFGGGLEWTRQDRLGLTHIDLQHALVGVDLCRHAFPVEARALWAAARPLDAGGTQALQLSAEDTLLHLCLHPPLHHGYAVPLRTYVDIDWLVASEGTDQFWRRLIERAAQFRARIVVYWALCCAQDLFGTPVPDWALDALAPRALHRHLLAGLAPLDPERVWAGGEQQPNGLHQLLIYAALMERPRDALRMVWTILFPGQEWLSVRYGLESKWRARLYRLAHPFRVARALLRSLRRPLIQSGLE
jgi:hypothetical protein